MREQAIRTILVAGMAAALASCAPGTQSQNPAAGLFNPFSGVNPDLRGAIGGPFDSSNAPQATGSTRIGPLGVPDTPPGAAPAPAAAMRSHTVVAGETGWSISRQYGIDIAALAAANGLDDRMTLRVGQVLAIPPAGGAAAATTGAQTSAPGVGTPVAPPPSASQPLPSETTVPAATPVTPPAGVDLGATRTAASSGGKFRMPVDGAITRTYAKGSNDGIDIAAPSGVPVKAAGGGTVAAVTRDPAGNPIVVIRHEGSLMTVYTGLGGLSVSKGDSVGAGQAIGTAGSTGNVHFEVRNGFESANPADYLG